METAIKRTNTIMPIGIKKRPPMNIGSNYLGLVKIKLFVEAITFRYHRHNALYFGINKTLLQILAMEN